MVVFKVNLDKGFGFIQKNVGSVLRQKKKYNTLITFIELNMKPTSFAFKKNKLSTKGSLSLVIYFFVTMFLGNEYYTGGKSVYFTVNGA